jgi:hypothetical protein
MTRPQRAQSGVVALVAHEGWPSVPGLSPHVFGDIVLLESLASNRIRNAFRAQRYGGSAEVITASCGEPREPHRYER